MTSLLNRTAPPDGPDAPDRLREWVLSHVTPFFLLDTPNDPTVSHEAARQMLVCYNAATGRELQLSAQAVVFAMAALDSLRCAMTERDMPVQVLLRMQSNAVRLNTLAEHSRKLLEAQQRDRHQGHPSTEASELNQPEFRAAIAKAQQMVAFARTKVEAHRVGKALAATSPLNARPAAKPARPPTIAAPMTPDVLARRRTADQPGSGEATGLSWTQGPTRH